MTIDSHHHLWRYSASEYDWIDESMQVLQRDFTAGDLEAAMRSAGVGRTVAVQARQTLDETRSLLAAAASHPRIAGVVGWLPLADAAALEAALTELSGNPLLKGARHVVQGEPAGFLQGRDFNSGMDKLQRAGLAYDLLLRADQLGEGTRFVDRHASGRIILDHIAKPRIAEGVMEPWATGLRALAERGHVHCKISGLVTEAVWDRWSLDTLRPYLDVVVDAFGPARLMAGSDWPVCLLASGYARWWQTLREYFAGFTAAEQNAVFGENAAAFYRLDP